MPAQKRSRESTPPPLEEKNDDLKQLEEKETTTPTTNNNEEEQADDKEVSDESPPSSPGEQDEIVTVKLSEIRKEVQCPICLGIIRKTRTVMDCLHRFCRECIDKAMRLGNNECPACRTHCASRRSLRDDPNYDALIAALYPDIEKYEEEELAFHEEEKARNKQIQASIAQTSRRQTEALGRKRTSARVTAAAFMRSQGNYRNLRRRRNHRAAERRESDDEQDANHHDGSKDSSSADERSSEVKSKRQKRWSVARSSPSSAGADLGAGENDSELREPLIASGLIGSSEVFTWGKGGIRSHNRHGSHGGNNKLPRNTRLSKLIDCLRCSDENSEGLDISLMLVSLQEDGIPSLQRPCLSCRPTLSVGHLREYVAMQTSMEAHKIEMLVIKDHPMASISSSSVSESKTFTVDPSKNELHKLQEHQLLEELQSMCSFNQQNMVLAYRQKL